MCPTLHFKKKKETAPPLETNLRRCASLFALQTEGPEYFPVFFVFVFVFSEKMMVVVMAVEEI